ncbi:hypothetical protein [Synechococcus sp. PCC 7336]|uniref:hypothetical protein n=1 Tax=Synechococcus sp. PCC 7336 TaxID=195250 RepID=UPI00034D004E|nr:hypothetical protein [Synechococcus sp. PCC 7336]
MLDERVETTVFQLLEQHSFEEILHALYGYAKTQAQLARMLQQAEASASWERQVFALNLAQAVLREGTLLAVEGE